MNPRFGRAAARPLVAQDSVREAMDHERVAAISSPDGGGDCYIRDRAAIRSLLEVFGEARDEYPKREKETRPAPDQRTVSPEQRFEMDYSHRWGSPSDTTSVLSGWSSERYR